jgi:hypothetical protein
MATLDVVSFPEGAGAEAEASTVDASGGGWLSWSELKNPILAVDGWAVKDVTVTYARGSYYFFLSAFWCDPDSEWPVPGTYPCAGTDGGPGGKSERSHIVATSSRDLKTFDPWPPRLLFDGKSEGWEGMVLPDLTETPDGYLLTFTSWGEQKPNQLYYATSSDLGIAPPGQETWSAMKPLGAALTTGVRAINGVIAHDRGRVFLMMQERTPDRSRLAQASSIVGPWQLVTDPTPTNPSGGPVFLTEAGNNNLLHSNVHFIAIDTRSADRSSTTWHALSIDGNAPFFYTMTSTGAAATDWLHFGAGYPLTVTLEEFNTDQAAGGLFMVDWRSYDGYFYLFYAGRTESVSHANRGDCKIGVSRSRDLRTWVPAGK